jgi:hypothetical protein
MGEVMNNPRIGMVSVDEVVWYMDEMERGQERK